MAFFKHGLTKIEDFKPKSDLRYFAMGTTYSRFSLITDIKK